MRSWQLARMAHMRLGDVSPEENAISAAVLDAAFAVHDALGPGPLERVYTECLAEELRRSGRHVRTEVAFPVVYRGRALAAHFRVDLLVDELVIVEVKAVEEIHPVHAAQLYTYLKLSRRRLGLLLNFNVRMLKDGIERVVCFGEKPAE